MSIKPLSDQYSHLAELIAKREYVDRAIREQMNVVIGTMEVRSAPPAATAAAAIKSILLPAPKTAVAATRKYKKRKKRNA